MRVNHDPKEGVQNINTMYRAMESDHVQVNFINIRPETQNQQRFGITEIKELTLTAKEDNSLRKDNGEMNVNPITVNKIQIG